MSEHDPNGAQPWQEPPNDWGQLPPEWQQPPGSLPPPPPPAGYQQPGPLPPPPPPAGYQQPPAGYQQPYTPYNPYGPQPGQRTEGLAIASLIVSVVGFLCFGVITGPIGIVLGVVARGRIDRDPTLKGRGLATAGIIVGACVFVLSLAGFLLLTRARTI